MASAKQKARCTKLAGPGVPSFKKETEKKEGRSEGLAGASRAAAVYRLCAATADAFEPYLLYLPTPTVLAASLLLGISLAVMILFIHLSCEHFCYDDT